VVRRSHVGRLFTLLRNPIYVGEIRHKGGLPHRPAAPIVNRAWWDKVAQLLRGHSTSFAATKPKYEVMCAHGQTLRRER